MAKNVFGEAVRSARIANGLSQAQLAKRIGASQATIDRIELGKIQRSRFLPDVAQALQIDVPLATGGSLRIERELGPGIKADTATVVSCLTAYVREHGKREGLLDALLPPERQEEGIARAMGLIEYLKKEDRT